MDQAYWLERERDAIVNARAATFADVQLIHYATCSQVQHRGRKGGKGTAQASREALESS